MQPGQHVAWRHLGNAVVIVSNLLLGEDLARGAGLASRKECGGAFEDSACSEELVCAGLHVLEGGGLDQAWPRLGQVCSGTVMPSWSAIRLICPFRSADRSS